MDSGSPQDVYARHLVSRRGYPLWTPEPCMSLPDVYREQGLKIGDVGVVIPEDGSFDVFFNICLPDTHSLHRETGVPNNFTPIQLEHRDVAIFPEAESAGRIISTSSVTRVGTQSSNESATSSGRSGPLNYEFTLSSKGGALLILPEGAERYYLKNQRPFLEEAIQHAVDWYHFAEQRLGRIVSHDSLYLITGFYKARSWSLASYQHASGTGGVHAQFKAVQVGGGNISTSYTWETSHAVDWRVGPSDLYYNGIANQSVFIQGFKIAVRSSILGAKRVKVKAQPPVVRPQKAASYYGLSRPNTGAKLPSSWFSASATNTPREMDYDSDMNIPEECFDSDSTHDSDGEDVTIQHIPEVPKPFHPSDIINHHLLQTYPSAVIAITHDSRWTELLHKGLFQPEDMRQEGFLEWFVYDMSPESREGVVYLQSITSDEDVEINASNDESIDPQEAYPSLPVEKYDAENRRYVHQRSPQSDTMTTKPQTVPNAASSELPTSPLDVFLKLIQEHPTPVKRLHTLTVPLDDIEFPAISGVEEVHFFQCFWESCGIWITSDKDAVKDHLTRAHGVVFNGQTAESARCKWAGCSSSLLKGAMVRHFRAHLGLSWSCSVCKVGFTRPDTVKWHGRRNPQCQSAQAIINPSAVAYRVDGINGNTVTLTKILQSVSSDMFVEDLISS